MRNTSSLWVPGLAVILVAASATACHHRSPVVRPSLTSAAAPVPTPRPVSTTRSAAPPAPRPLTEEEIFARESLDQLNGDRPLGDAFFDYDSATIKPEGQASLAKDAAWLSRWKTTKVTVSGHCDERGTAEYNLALGERRADAVKAYLQSLGVSSDRITTVSYGKERPFCTGDSEQCWSQNRRGHFLITAK
jgi:peptidoglycan-associated lipoprotein